MCGIRDNGKEEEISTERRDPRFPIIGGWMFGCKANVKARNRAPVARNPLKKGLQL